MKEKKIFTAMLTTGILFLIIYSVCINTGYNKANDIMSGEGDSVFSGTQIYTIHMNFSQANYWDSLLYYYYQGLEQCMSCNINIDGRTFSNVGVRMKGNSSFTYPNNKKPFKISFNEYVSSMRWNGLKSVSLNNCWNDPTFIREKLHLDICRAAGIPAPRCNFVKLYINDSLFGLYSMVESVDKTFLSSRYGNNGGIYFKAVDARDTGTQYYSDFAWYGTDSLSYKDRYELKATGIAGAWNQLINIIDTINHSNYLQTSLPLKANTNSVYRAMAMDNLFGNLDAYMHTGRNFYVYFNTSTSKMEWIIWDVSLTFGALPGGGISSIETLPLNYVIDSAQRPLLGKIVNNSALRDEYLTALCLLANSYLNTTYLYPRIDSLANFVRTEVYNDPRKMYTNSQFETNLITDITVLGSRKPGLKSYVTLRSNNVQTQLTNFGINCSSGINPGEELTGTKYQLRQNYPNPFNPETKINYYLPKNTSVTLKIYSITGQEVRTLVNNLYETNGTHAVKWDGKDNSGNKLASGIYLYMLQTPDFLESKKMVLVK